MKILLCNKFYYRRGGDCIYTLDLEQLLKEHGHDIAVFAMQYPENLPSEWSKYFPSEVKFKPGLGMVEAFRRPFGTNEVKRKFCALLDDFQPDVLHMNNIHSQLSPVIGELAHERGIRVVWTIHDYKLLCPRYEGLPMSLIEAMSMGVVPISTPAGGVVDVIEDGITGYLTKTFDDEEFYLKVKQALYEKGKISSEVIKKHFEKYFSMETCAKNYYETYRSLINK